MHNPYPDPLLVMSVGASSWSLVLLLWGPAGELPLNLRQDPGGEEKMQTISNKQVGIGL